MKYYLTDEQVRALDKIASEMRGERGNRLSPMEIQDMGEAIYGIIEHEAAEENEVVVISLAELRRIKTHIDDARRHISTVLIDLALLEIEAMGKPC